MFFRRLSGTPRTAKLEEISNRGLLLCKDKTPNYYVRKGELRTSNGLAVVKLQSWVFKNSHFWEKSKGSPLMVIFGQKSENFWVSDMGQGVFLESPESPTSR